MKAKRIMIYLLGILLVSTGIVLCKKCNLGISPISSVPFVLEKIVPLSFGTLTMLFHFVNITIQLILEKKCNVTILMQVPLAFVFGIVIDFEQRLIQFDNTFLLYQVISLILSVLFTAAGMICMIDMNFIQNPPDGVVRKISQITGRELGKVKICYDVICAVIAILIGILFLKRIEGMGVATIVSAIFVGKTVTWMRRFVYRK